MSLVEIVDIGEGPRPYPTPLPANIGGHAVLYGFALKESTGTAPAEVDIYDQAGSGGILAIPITLGPGVSTSDWFGPQGIHLRGGMNAVVASGAVIGSLFIHIVGREGQR